MTPAFSGFLQSDQRLKRPALPLKFLSFAALTLLFFAAHTQAFSQTCGQGSVHITIGGVQATPFQQTCPNTTITYGITGTPMSLPSWGISPSGAGTFVGGSSGTSVSVTWHANGTLRLNYPDMQGSQCEELYYTMTSVTMGTVSGPDQVCTGNDFTLTLSGSQNAGASVWQRCTSGCENDSNWTTISPVTGSPLPVEDHTVTTSFRTRLENAPCNGGIKYSNVKTVTAAAIRTLHVAITDHGPVCASSVAGLVFTVTPSSELGLNPTFEWLRNGTPAQGDATDPDDGVYDPYDANYGFHFGEQIQVKVTSNRACDSPNPVYSDPVFITQKAETFPTLNGIVINPNPICSGGQTTFTVSTSTSGGNISANWSIGEQGSPFNGTNYILSSNTLNGNVVNVSATVVGTCGTSKQLSTHTGPLTVNTSYNPWVSLSDPGPICEGTTPIITATAHGIGGFSVYYEWYVDNDFKTQNTTGTFSPAGLANGNDIKVVMKVVNPVCIPPSAEAIREITVKPRPNASVSPVSQTVCSGIPTTVAISNPNAVPGTSFSWTVDQSNVSGAESGNGGSIGATLTNVSGMADGSATYTVTPSANGCSGDAVNATIHVRPLPRIVSSSGVYLGYESDLQFSTGTYYSYQWKLANIKVLGADRQTYAPEEPGEYTVEVKVNATAQQCVSEPFLLKDAVVDQTDVNYIIENTLLTEGFGVNSSLHALAPKDFSQITTYFDGLGRPMQKVITMGSPQGNDVVQPIVYDASGREHRKYLPFVPDHGTGRYKDNSTIIHADPQNGDYTGIAATFYNNPSVAIADDGNKPFAETIFEKSPLDRPVKQGAAGAVWQPDNVHHYDATDRTVKTAYAINESQEVLKWTYTAPTTAYPLGTVNAADETPAILRLYYGPGELFKNKTKDEHQNEVIEYIDREGHTVLKRVQAVAGTPVMNETNYASTYYVYDDFGDLVCVLPPEATRLITDIPSAYFGKTQVEKEAFLAKWAFRYRYDERKRMKIKQVPGADSVVMVYDKRDRLVLTQDGNQRDADKWSFTKYDHRDRVIISGTYSHGTDIDSRAMSGLVSATNFFETYTGAATGHGYTNNVFPTANTDVLTVAYYDDYAFKTLLNNSDFDYKNNELPATGGLKAQDSEALGRIKNLVGGTKSKVLGTSTWLWSVNYYDYRYRVIQHTASNYKEGYANGGFHRTTNVYDFAGKVLRTKDSYTIPGQTDKSIVRRFSYDHAGRLLKKWHRVEGGTEVVLASNQYNELGQLVTKRLHQVSMAQGPVTADPLAGQPGVRYAANIVSEEYSSSEPVYLASGGIRLLPGFNAPANSTFRGKIGFSAEDALAHNNAINGAFLQSIDYRYNIRGWLQSINDPAVPVTDDLFSMALRYNDPVNSGGVPQYNGNISEAVWKSAGLDKQLYGYHYDAMNRLTKGIYFNTQRPAHNGRYTEKIGDVDAATPVPGYDLNGNILKLFRHGKSDVTFGAMDQLSYTHNGNQLLTVSDDIATQAGEEGFTEIESPQQDYTYDFNGNMTADGNKDITVEYNELNLTSKALKSENEYVAYTYDARGRKLSRKYVTGSTSKTTTYIGELVFEDNNLQLILHEEGRIVPDQAPGASDPWEYQYFMKDHLGNVRIAFSEKKSTTEYKATMESNTQANETAVFRNYNSGVRSAMPLFDHTDVGTTYTYSQLLNGGSGSQVGLAKSFEVNPGDVFDLEVYAKYEDPISTANDVNALLSQLISAFSLGAGTSPLDGAAAQAKFTNLFSAGPWINSSRWENDPPKAYLNYILFDESFTLVDFGFDQISTAGRQSGTEPMPHDYLSLHVQVEKKGYLYVYLSNEQPTVTNVYFDDLKIVRYSAVEQISDYYPFGLTFNSYSKENGVAQNYLYNGKELQDNLSLAWLDYGARMYMPEIGRWGVIDPEATRLHSTGPYNFGHNNPINFIDPEGKIPVPVIYFVYEGLAYAFTAAATMYVVTNHEKFAIPAIRIGEGAALLETRRRASKDQGWKVYLPAKYTPIAQDYGQPKGYDMEPNPKIPNEKDPNFRRIIMGAIGAGGISLLSQFEACSDEIKAAKKDMKAARERVDQRINQMYDELDPNSEDYKMKLAEKELLQKLRAEYDTYIGQLDMMQMDLDQAIRESQTESDVTINEEYDSKLLYLRILMQVKRAQRNEARKK